MTHCLRKKKKNTPAPTSESPGIDRASAPGPVCRSALPPAAGPVAAQSDWLNADKPAAFECNKGGNGGAKRRRFPRVA